MFDSDNGAFVLLCIKTNLQDINYRFAFVLRYAATDEYALTMTFNLDSHMNRHVFFFSFFSIFTACQTEDAIKIYNSVPQATITSHASGSEVLEGVEYTFVGQVNDDNHEESSLQVTWSTDVRELCPDSVPDVTGATACRVALETSDTQLKLQVIDPEGSVSLALIDINVLETEAPTIELISPILDGAYYSDQLILFSAIINDSEDAPSDLSYTWSSNIDGDLPISAEPDTDGTINSYLNLSAGQHAISLRVEDTGGKSKTETVAITVGGPNSEPLCEITSPQEEAAYVLGQNISFAGTATDDDINNALLSISWESNRDGIFDTTAANSTGGLGFSFSELSVGNHTITLRVEDEVGGLCTDTVQLAVGTPPTLSLGSPTDADVYSVGDLVSFQAEVSDQEDVPSDISLSWTSDIDGEFSTQGPNSNGAVSFNVSDLSVGLHSISVVATDSTGLTDSTTLTIRINTPPDAPVVEITPNPAQTNDALIAVVSGSTDADGDNILYSYSWTKNGNATTYSSSSVPSSATSYGEVWTVRVTPNDGYTDGNFTEVTSIIENTEPTIDSIIISPSMAYNDEVLTCMATVSDPDETLSPTYTWSVGSNTYQGSSLDLSLTSVLPNDSVVCTVEVVDSSGASASSSQSLLISNRDPIVSGTTITPISLYTNSEATCSAGVTDADGEILEAIYEWFVGTNSLGSGATISLDSSIISVGDSLTCTASASDGYGGSHSDSVSSVIINTDPTVDTVSIDMSMPIPTDTITCSAQGSDSDGDTVSYSFSWRNITTGVVYTSTTINSSSVALDLSTTNIAVNDELECTVVVSDSNGGNASDVSVVSIYNSGPEFDVEANINISPSVYVGDSLVCSAVASDTTDGSITPSYSWSVNGSIFATGSSYTVDSSNTNVGDTLVCTATAVDSDGETAESTASVTVANSAPTLSGTTISGGTYNTDTLTCSAVGSDPDESLAVSYTWSIDSTDIGVGASIDLGTTAALPNDDVVCTSYIEDSSGVSASETATLTLLNRAPTEPIIEITPSSPIEQADDLICSVTTPSVDLDGDAVTYEFSWTVNGTSFTNFSTSITSSTVDASYTSAQEEWICFVTPSDSTIDGSVADSSVVIDSDWGDMRTFTNCGQTGYTGPSSTQCDSSYSGTSLEGEVNVVGGFQYWTVPVTGVYSIEAAGALGGGTLPGNGAVIYGEFSLTAGDILEIVVGQKGKQETSQSPYIAGGGGGGTFVVLNSSPLIVAGGGGGSGRANTGYGGITSNSSSTTGSSGQGGSGQEGGGGAGFYGDGGASAHSGDTPASSFQNGALGGIGSPQGGQGYGGFGGGGAEGYADGGGGGGYSGGNEAGNTNGAYGGGSYNSGANTSDTADSNADHGYVIIEKL